jgi:hypothetical protein
MGAVAAFATVIFSCPRGSLNRGDTQGTRAYIAADTADAIRDVVPVLLPTVSEKFCRTNTHKSTRGQVTIMVVVVFFSFFANVDHAVIATVVLVVAPASSL